MNATQTMRRDGQQACIAWWCQEKGCGLATVLAQLQMHVLNNTTMIESTTTSYHCNAPAVGPGPCG